MLYSRITHQGSSSSSSSSRLIRQSVITRSASVSPCKTNTNTRIHCCDIPRRRWTSRDGGLCVGLTEWKGGNKNPRRDERDCIVWMKLDPQLCSPSSVLFLLFHCSMYVCVCVCVSSQPSIDAILFPLSSTFGPGHQLNLCIVVSCVVCAPFFSNEPIILARSSCSF